MSERDLPSKVDSEQQQQRPIPSSKSVPALHQIHSPTGEQPQMPQQQQQSQPTNNRPNNAAVYHENYSRTSSNNSINQNGQQQQQQVRSRSTHNLHQQDAGFYQNLSVYRNKVPSPQQLGDRTSALHSSQNSLHSSVMANSQRPSSAYYPPANANPRPNNLHQSIPNLKSPPTSGQRSQNDAGNLHQSIPNLKAIPDGRTGSYLQQYGQNYYQQYMRQQQGGYPSPEVYNNPYGGGQNQPYPSPTHNVPSNYPNSVQQPLHINPNSRLEDRQEIRYNNVGGGLLREDVYRHSQNSRHDEIMRYPSQTNVRISEAQINEMRGSKSEDALRYHLQQSEMPRYASSGNIREHKGEVSTAHIRQNHEHRLSNEDRHLRGAAKLAEMSEEVRRRQNRIQHGHQQQQQQQLPNRDYYQQQQQQQQYYNHIMSQNTQNMQNLNVAQQYAQNSYGHGPLSPTYKIPPVAPKPNRKDESGPPDLPPTSTHPLYSASSQDLPKMSFYPVAAAAASSKIPRDPWTREEQERQQEARREAARQWQEQQIRELTALPYRTAQQEEQLRVLKLEREFQRRAMEAQQEEEGDEDTEKESPIPTSPLPLPVSSQTVISTLTSTTVSSKSEPNQAPPMSILKPGATNNGNNNNNNSINNNTNHQQQQQQSQPSPTEAAMTLPPAPPERGSSFAVMSMRGGKESTKRVSFNDVAGGQQQGQQGQQQQQHTPNSLQIEEIVREDPNSFIRQAESMLASPVTPTDPSMPGGVPMSTPGVIGAQEVYRDPRARRLAEQAQKRDQTAVPEKLSFKEKMKMFAMETGEQETPKDKSKISRAQRDIDNLSSPPTSGLVH